MRGPMRFPMTLGGLTKVMTFAALAGMSVVLPIQYFVVLRHIPLPGMKLDARGAPAPSALLTALRRAAKAP